MNVSAERGSVSGSTRKTIIPSNALRLTEPRSIGVHWCPFVVKNYDLTSWCHRIHRRSVRPRTDAAQKRFHSAVAKTGGLYAVRHAAGIPQYKKAGVRCQRRRLHGPT